ncbi:FAD-dependent oxidoreductase [Thiomicrospira pelophila]|uniref:FAD-dependent oxidoreductase n=1 Tax=Thiomicrospira pelophila TaxID=934 RepID=UPI0004A76F6D|nr:FAD-dependent oxidoreductase [Thiomicrospira pelophila]
MKLDGLKTVGIAGAGLVGRVLALNLIQRGIQVTLYEKDASDATPNAAGYTAAGMLAPYAELELMDAELFKLGTRSIALWPGLLAWMAQQGYAVDFQHRGSLILAHHNDRADLQHFMRQLLDKMPAGHQNSQVEPLNNARISELEPELTHHHQAWWLPNEGQVDSTQFFAQSERLLKNHPLVEWRVSTEAKEVEAHVVHCCKQQDYYDWVFDCRGLGAKAALKDLRGVRGEVLWLDAPEVNLTRPVRLMHPRYRIYIVPRANGRYIIGASEIESEDRSPMSVRSSLELLSAAYSVHPGFAEARIVNQLTNCRPALGDNLPRIEQLEGLTRINGLYRHGYLFSPAMIEKALAELKN